ncbi:MAG: DUF3263 domain-containing protein [Candidatus Nanopelagicales bacterium]|jgi:hypothetical protein
MTSVSFDEYDRDPKEKILEGFGSLEEKVMYESTSVRSNPETSGAGLSERDRAVLGFERQWWKYSGAKEAAIRELFDMSATRYYQLINSLIDTPEAMEFDPMMVKRLRRMRSSRQASRSANRSNIR